MPTKEAGVLKREFRDKRTELRNFEIAWHHLSLGWRIILVLGVLSAVWIIFKLIYSLRTLFSAG